MRSIDQPIVSAIIVSKDGKLLMGQKPPHKAAVYPDCWHIPGGGVEPGEPHAVALRREILEETGVDIRPYAVELVDDKGGGEGVRTLENGEKVLAKMQFNVFRVTIDEYAKDIAVEARDDLEHLTWFSIDTLTSVKLTPPSITLFRRLGYMV